MTQPPKFAETSASSIAVLNKNVLYARLPVLGIGVDKAFAAAAEKARSERTIIGTILDLRGSQGGLISDIVRFLDLFFDDDVLIQERVRANGRTVVERATRNPPAPLDPIVVLIDEHTASGSEAAAASFRKSNRAMILGRKSMGWASVGTTAFLPSKSLLRFPTGDLWELDVGPITGHGVKPDVEFLDSTPSQSTGKEDRMLEAAYEVLLGSPSGTRQDLIATAKRIVGTYRKAH
jgi:C-terminal processing protease CtpA/Prc